MKILIVQPTTDSDFPRVWTSYHIPFWTYGYPSRRNARLRYEWFWAFSLWIDSKVFNLILEQKQWQQSNRPLSCVRSLNNYETRMVHCKVLQSTNKEDCSTFLHTMLYNCFHTRQLTLTFTFIQLAQWIGADYHCLCCVFI